MSTETLINDLVEIIRVLEDKLIGKDDTLNEEEDVEIFISESNVEDSNKNDPQEELVDYHSIVCSKWKFKTI